MSIRELTVVRGRATVLRSPALDVRGAAVTGLLGPSGSGKSTLVRAIVGVQRISRGEVRVRGRPAGSPSLRRRVAYVTQAPSVYADLTVAENLRYFARVPGVPPPRVAEVLATTGLESHAGRIVGTLSGGERSRASLAAALLGDPEVLVLDEPTVGLDPVLRAELWESFRGLARRGRTVIVSTHVMDEAERCDELALLREGRLVAADSPSKLLERTGTDSVEQAFMSLAAAGAAR